MSKNMKSINFFGNTIIKSLWQLISHKVAKRLGVEGILNYLPISEAIATAGQPQPGQFEHIRGRGYKTIVNLAPSNSAKGLPNESELVESLGMAYVHLPVDWGNSTSNDFQEFCQILDSHQEIPVFENCAMNMRVFAFIYLYRRLYQGVAEVRAKSALAQIWQPNQTWQNFIGRTIQEHSQSSC
jgi:protein tyrosine phosphatase (PTP) superfamily phosphohydrolase (DUF442 family)